MRSIKQLGLIAGVGLLLLLVITIVSQTAQVVTVAAAVNPRLGTIVLYGLLSAYGLLSVLAVSAFLRLPAPLRPPVEGSKEHQEFLIQLGSRLRRNPHLIRIPCRERAEIEAAIRHLDGKATDLIKNSAKAVFVSTAVSQNGRLDAVMVLAAQVRMIWHVAHVYHQRPGLRELVSLYANVAASVFAASELEELDIREQVEPVLKAALGSSVIGLIPGVSGVASIITQSILEGTANAFLTLRVGIICSSYCGAITVVNSTQARRKATLAAASMLGSIVAASASGVVKAMVTAARKAGESTIEAASSSVRDIGSRLNPFKTKGEI